MSEYLLFDLIVLAGPLVCSFFPVTRFTHRFAAAAIALLAAAPAFVLWDILVTGRHWDFNPKYVLPLRIAGIPLEEWLFFFTVPFACLYTWELVFKPWRGAREQPPAWLYSSFGLLIPIGAALWWQGLEYTALVCFALAIAASIDVALDTKLWGHSRFFGFFVMVNAFTLVFNGYLTARPVVLYDAAYQLDLRIYTIPIEDFGFGWALVWIATSVFESVKARPLARLVERRMGGYRHRIVDAGPAPGSILARDAAGASGPTPRVLVIGGGLAGMTTALHLAERGLPVVLREGKAHLGGKLGAWRERLPSGEEQVVEHGFHAFFRHYYNLDTMLNRLGIRQGFVQVPDYKILTVDRGEFGFQGIHKTPALNLVSLMGTRIVRFRELATNREAQRMRAFLEWSARDTPGRWDDVSFAAFSEATKLPRNLRLVFNSFSRAFFAEPEDMSMGELVKSFHFYFLSHDHGLEFDYPTEDHDTAILSPLRAAMADAGVEIRTHSPVRNLRRDADGWSVDGERFDRVVLASDVRAAGRLVRAVEGDSPGRDALAERLARIAPRDRYAVLRVWLDRDTPRDLPGFVIVDKRRILDSISLYHRIEGESRRWAEDHGGGVFELHAYSIPKDMRDEAAIRRALLDDFEDYFPELKGAALVHESFAMYDDFTSFAPGLMDVRPPTTTEIPGLLLAGDWVKLPCPAMLMEGAVTSGLVAANAILDECGLARVPIDSVPLVGLLHGLGAPTEPSPAMRRAQRP
jgi:isorenieratene synthase